MKIKIIDLLNKSANGESLPLKIKYGGYEFQYDIINNCYVDKNDLMLEDHVNFFSKINDEVEIIEEDKKIEKLKIKDGKITGNWGNGNYYCYTLSSPQAVIVNKLNELVDEVNKLKENE